MMTISYIFDNTDDPISDMTSGVAGIPLDSGAGHLKSNKAMDPGLLYDTEVNDYNNFVRALNYTRERLKVITRRSSFSCRQGNIDLNNPSLVIILNNTNTTSYTFKRAFTNVVKFKLCMSCCCEDSVDYKCHYRASDDPIYNKVPQSQVQYGSQDRSKSKSMV
ncbi:hypothetical protein RJ639_047489 [Escallonia herrerae]|uniref:Uncharacterized protein n=1 Tax=Escallonia herrerae TaxID=1293975 RepID=A0AA88W7K2_9ASTE|nr:hypothetical protein RJ639_047489 [Escallonia herrerae]